MNVMVETAAAGLRPDFVDTLRAATAALRVLLPLADDMSTAVARARTVADACVEAAQAAGPLHPASQLLMNADTLARGWRVQARHRLVDDAQLRGQSTTPSGRGREVKVVEARGGRMLFVELTAPEEVLMARVGNESRHRANKMTTPERLRLMLDARDHRASVKQPEHPARLDTSQLSPAEAVASILPVAQQR
ncbi:MAG TPA: hypothetical protein VG247_34730 [Pseudonocardiaceae bacterium]|jgi:hypothetical protein|nr:hypothetical protein [Pseudonocardiaceae bacterium]